MNKTTFAFILSFFLILTITGCGNSVRMGNHTVGISSGRFFHNDGFLRTKYSGASFDNTWNACIKAMDDLGVSVTGKERKIAKGTVSGMINEEVITVTVEYIDRDTTLVGVQAGHYENTPASRSVHDKIKDNLLSKDP